MKALAPIILCLSWCALLPGCKKDSPAGSGDGQTKTITDLVVKNNEIAGWTYSGSGWTANNLSELTTYIDGAADIYRQHGFIEASHQEYQGTVNSASAVVKLTVYSQGTSTNASQLYADPALGFNGAIDWAGGAGDAAHYVRNGGLSQVLAFYRNGHFVYIEINADTNESLNVIQQFALNVDGKIKNG